MAGFRCMGPTPALILYQEGNVVAEGTDAKGEMFIGFEGVQPGSSVV